MDNRINDSLEILTDDDIKKVEKILNIELPRKIRNFYLKNNGGMPERDIFYSDGYEYMVNEFYPLILKNMGDSVVKVHRELKDVLPDWFIVIGDDGGDGLYGFSIYTKELGAIYYWEGDYDYGENPENHVVYLSESIETFLDGMVCGD